MPSPVPEYEPQRLADEAEQFWRARRLPPERGIFGPPDGPILHQFEGGIVTAEESTFVAQRAVAADVDARYHLLVGLRSVGTLRWGPTGTVPDALPEARLLRKLAIWTGGTGAAPWDTEDRRAKIEQLVGRLARRGVVVSRDLPLRFCPTCVAPRSPERIIYQEEVGDTYLVRFEIPLDGRSVNALVWVDAPWRLLGTSALLVHPEAPYVVARYRRKESEELVLTARSSLERFREWIPGATFEVLEERPGREFAGRPYVYPLRHEFPMGGALAPPGGTLLAATDVTGTGTGIVLLVPGHQSTDAIIAESLGVTGWPLLTPKGRLDATLVHKYAGLDLKTASEFVVRDLAEGDAIFADLRVHHGVPHCLVCGTALIWFPGKAWCLEPGRLPPEMIELYRRLLPGAPPLHRVEVAPWPVSETSTSDVPGAVALLECNQCERLGAIDGPATCHCGGTMFATRRRLVPSAEDVFSAWARWDPLPPGDTVRLYVGERRRVPAVIHHLAGLASVEGAAATVAITVLPTLPEVDLGRLVESEGADAVRAALVRTEAREGTASTFPGRCSQERRRLERLWSVATELLSQEDPEMLAAFLEPISGHLDELETEDRALVARWERTRVATIADYDRGAIASAHRRVFRFFETDLADYRRWTRDRLGLRGGTSSKRGAMRAMSYVLRTAIVLLGPIVPYTADAIFRRMTGDRRSLFETDLGGAERSLLDERLQGSWDRWRSFLDAVAAFRRSHAIDAGVTIPRVVIVLAADEEGDRLREVRDVLERLGGISQLEIASPREPWTGRQRTLRPIESEIQRIYPRQASQIAHLLRRMPPRRSGEGTGSPELSVVIQGLPRRVLPSMVNYLETLPEGMVPSPWKLGELYLEIPGSGRAQRPTPPPLSPDAFWLVRRVERRLKRSRGARDRSARTVVVSASDPLASELRGVAEHLARYLEVSEVRIPETIAEAPPPHRIRGRTGTGARWWVDIPGLPAPSPRSKGRIARPPSRRVPLRRESSAGDETEFDYADEKVIAEEEAVRALNRELDSVLHVAVLGPSKVRAAWGRGFRDLDRYRNASLDELLELPGFGRGAAEGLVLAFGGTASGPAPSIGRPPPSPRVALRSARPAVAALPSSRGVEAEPLEISAATSPPALEGDLRHVTPHPLPSRPEPAALAPPSPPSSGGPTIPLPGETLPSEPAIAVGPASEPRLPAAPELPPEKAAPPAPEAPGQAAEAAMVAESPSSAEVTESDTVTPTTDAGTPPDTGASVEVVRSSEESPLPVTGPEPNPEPSPPTREEGAARPRDPTAPAAVLEEVYPIPIPEPTGPPAPPPEPPEAQTEASPSDRSASAGSPGAISNVDVMAPVDTGPEDAALPPIPVPDTESPVLPSDAPATGSGETSPPSIAESPGPTGPASPEPLLSPSESPLPVPIPEEIANELPAEPPSPARPAPTAPTRDVEQEAAPGPAEPVPGSEETPGQVVPSDTVPVPPVESPGFPGPGEPDEARVVPEPGAPASFEAPEVPLPSSALSSAPESVPEAPMGSVGPEPEVASVDAVPEAEAPPPPEVEPVPPPVPEPPRGGIELMVGASVVASLQPFLAATAAGLKGVCVVRESPERIRAHAGSRPVEIYWLTNMARDRTLRPNDLPGFASFLTRAIDESHAQLFFIEGVEYLTHIHGAEAVVARLDEFDRHAKEHEVRVWLHVTPGLLRPGELERILAAFPTAP